MEGYGLPYPAMRPPGDYPDHGDGYGEFYNGMQTVRDHERRTSRPKQRTLKSRGGKRSRSASDSKSRSAAHSKSRSRSNSRSRSRPRARTRSRSKSGSTRSSVSRGRDLNLKEPSFLDAFRVLYLTPSKSKKNTTKYLATKKRQDRIDELLKSDGLGSKRWLFYPRSNPSEPVTGQVAGPRDNSDQRVKIDGQFFKKYKRSKSVARDAPIAKLKRWELIFYKKFGFIRAE